MARLSRPHFLALTRLELGQLKTLDRRGQLPFAIDQAQGRGYEAAEAFLTLMAQELAEGHALSVTRAANIAASLADALSEAWPAVVETGRVLAAGTDTPPNEILAGRAEAAYPAPPLPICGTIVDIAENLASAGFKPRRLIVTSASTVMAVLIQRAQALGVELPAEFWTAPLKCRPRPAPLTAEDVAKLLQETKR
ncbi:hypothetical protein [Methylobacterium radiotolerans]|nr:hypothetical protein [Methylobacterium radiotolerans]GEN01734.1 hypothetical protein MRA01_62730 [Methylobacterium radiotolerans]